jgi:hypothetical protein
VAREEGDFSVEASLHLSFSAYCIALDPWACREHT